MKLISTYFAASMALFASIPARAGVTVGNGRSFSCNANYPEEDYQLGVTESLFSTYVLVESEVEIQQYQVTHSVNWGFFSSTISSPVLDVTGERYNISEAHVYNEVGLYTRGWSVEVFSCNAADDSTMSLLKVSNGPEQVMIEEDNCIDYFQTPSPTLTPYPSEAPSQAPSQAPTEISGSTARSRIGYNFVFILSAVSFALTL
jgi:hypothetical protein